ncbi:MAG: dUTP diphosphatase [candidate division WOR-3 bacterium]
MTKVRIRVGPKGFLPEYQSPGASGMDIAAAERVVVAPGAHAAVPTDLYLQLPRGLEVQVRPRSGLALKHGVGILNSPGTIDADYRGEIIVILFNIGPRRFVVERGDRIAQLVFAHAVHVRLTTAQKLSRTRRGVGGFGHTGK